MRFNFNLETIKYLKILCKDSKGNPVLVKAAIKRIDEREILACAKFDEKLIVTAPQEITLSVICADGLYRTGTKLKSVENAEPYTFFVMETPQGLEYQQNREYFRIKALYDCVYTIRTLSGTQEFKSKTCDISANGISIILPAHFITESDAKISINISGRIIDVKARYVRSEKIETGYKISFTYVKINEPDRDYISQTCIQKQLQERRNSIH